MIFASLIDKTSTATRAAAERAKARRAQKIDPATLRRPERRQDRELMEHAVLWANGLPSELRPNLLLERYPRVANRLALCWPDKRLTHHLFEVLLVDNRGGRKGFPPPVRAELLQLRRAFSKPIPAGSMTPHWEQYSQATDLGSLILLSLKRKPPVG